VNPDQIDRAAYIAAHAILAADTSAPDLACPGARRSHEVDAIAGIIKSVFEVHRDELDAFTDWWERPASTRHPNFSVAATAEMSKKSLPIRAESAVQTDRKTDTLVTGPTDSVVKNV
jgi:hypothetical protein